MLKRIIIHWTAGTYNVNTDVLNSYHYAVNNTGKIIACNHRPEDNIDCKDGNYAPHTGGGNTGSIGVAMCGMYVPNGFNVKSTKYPLTKIQCETTFQLVAELAKKYNILIKPETILTHYEFGKAHPDSSSAGKIDIIYLTAYPHVEPSDIGAFIRTKVKWYYNHL